MSGLGVKGKGDEGSVSGGREGGGNMLKMGVYMWMNKWREGVKGGKVVRG